LLSDGLKSPNFFPNYLQRSCKDLNSVLSSESSSLKLLDLRNNDLKDSGVNPNCELETLSLSGCLVSEEGCSSLVSALLLNPNHLRELDLSYNHPGDSGEQLLSILQQDPDCRLETLRLDHGGAHRLKSALNKYSCKLTVDMNTVHRNLRLSDNNRKVTNVKEDQLYPDHPDRFEFWFQLLCSTGLTGRCYWEVQWSGVVHISVSYRGIRRKGHREGSLFGRNNQSWCLICSDVDGYSVWHNNIKTSIRSSSASRRIGVYVDVPAGVLSFYRVSFGSPIHLHTFSTTFTEPLYPGFGLSFGSSVSLGDL
uniref:NACHT, LRR and PYD domains-containing protein 12-like n=1 Tax=Acanthochromis polyacanthus TaxID=80966 RepID=A0A3Q1FQE8_9TELE